RPAATARLCRRVDRPAVLRRALGAGDGRGGRRAGGARRRRSAVVLDDLGAGAGGRAGADRDRALWLRRGRGSRARRRPRPAGPGRRRRRRQLLLAPGAPAGGRRPPARPPAPPRGRAGPGPAGGRARPQLTVSFRWLSSGACPTIVMRYVPTASLM